MPLRAAGPPRDLHATAMAMVAKAVEPLAGPGPFELWAREPVHVGLGPAGARGGLLDTLIVRFLWDEGPTQLNPNLFFFSPPAGKSQRRGHRKGVSVRPPGCRLYKPARDPRQGDAIALRRPAKRAVASPQERNQGVPQRPPSQLSLSPATVQDIQTFFPTLFFFFFFSSRLFATADDGQRVDPTRGARPGAA